LQPLQIPQWKWDEIGMDFIVGLPRTRASYESIWVVVDHLTKADHFIQDKTTYNSAVLAELYMSWIVCLHGVPKKIVSDRGTQFTSHFWQQLHEAFVVRRVASKGKHIFVEDDMTRDDDAMEGEIKTVIPLVVRRVAKEEAASGAGRQLVRGSGRGVGIAGTAEHPKVAVGGVVS
jgi:hypothetical protein